jgi:histidinol dehydrogenase
MLRIADWLALDGPARTAALARPVQAMDPAFLNRVAGLVAEVRGRGDAALQDLTRELDRVELTDFRVSPAEVAAAGPSLTADDRAAIEAAIANVRRFHAAQFAAPLRVETAPGVVCERVSVPIGRVGLYVPAGSAPLPSTAIMLAVPAAIAGCPLRVLCTPPRADGRADPAVVYAASACGIDHIYKLGGAQAIAAMAYGTATVPKVDKIFGPGNSWVTAAKALVATDPAGAALDMPAGPSEVLVVADADADPRYVALDLLAQAEHGPDSHVVLVTVSRALVDAVAAAIAASLPGLPRRAIIERALAGSVAVLVPDLATAIDVANHYAPEHLILQVADARGLVADVRTAGSVFIGAFTPESVGDYCSGTNHVLPTYGFARAYSGLSLADFQRRMTLQEVTRPGLEGLAPTVTRLAALEGLGAHAAAVTVRLDGRLPGAGGAAA